MVTRFELTIPSCHEAERIVDEMAGQANETPCYWEIAHHLRHGVVHNRHCGTIERKGQEEACRSTLCETIADTNEKPSANGPACSSVSPGP